ncbi:hypothetical protein HAX54_002728, partial [Datura stramonium]|nr:hypothetical protein [Datura stramonium]
WKPKGDKERKSSAPPNMVEEGVWNGNGRKILKETFKKYSLDQWRIRKSETPVHKRTPLLSPKKVESGENESKPVAHWRNADDIVNSRAGTGSNQYTQELR